MEMETVSALADFIGSFLGINPFAAGLIAVTIVGQLFLMKKVLKEHIEKIIHRIGIGSEKKLSLSIKQDVVINDALAHIVFSLSAKRAFVFQRHNGDHNAITGNSFKKISMTHEFAEPGVSLCSPNWQSLPLGLFANWYERLQKDNEMQIPDADAIKGTDTSGYQILKDAQVAALYLVSVFKFESSEPLAFVGIAYSRPVELSDNQMDSLRSVALKICGCLLIEDE